MAEIPNAERLVADAEYIVARLIRGRVIPL
jgi:hypothetical protein